MRLGLDFITAWPREDVAGVSVYAVPGYALQPDLWFEVFPIVPRTRFQTDQVLLHDLGSELEVRRAPMEVLRTPTGWPIAVHSVTVHAGGELREIRMLAHYQLLVLSGFAMVRATNPKRFEDHRADIRELFQSARPQLASDEPASIADLWTVT